MKDKNDYTIIFEDEHMLVVNKPAGIVVIPERVHTGKECLQKLLEVKYGKVYVVHRIDRDTSGLVCFARNEEVHKALSQMFEKHEVQKFYKAFVRGRVKDKQGRIEAPIAENPAHPGTMLVHPKGKASLTLYTVEEELGDISLLDIEIKTGRTHQIRVHLSYIGHPLLVDKIYGKTEDFRLSSVKRGYKEGMEGERPLVDRLTLHAFRLVFTHPVTGVQITCEAPMPKDLNALLKVLRKYGK